MLLSPIGSRSAGTEEWRKHGTLKSHPNPGVLKGVSCHQLAVKANVIKFEGCAVCSQEFTPTSRSRKPTEESLVSKHISLLVLLGVSTATADLLVVRPAGAYVPLMAGQQARPLNGTFNNVPVLHSNQPEIVKGSGILVNTQPGSSIAAETNKPLRNAMFTFNGEFGLHMHHKYYPSDQRKMGGVRQRGLLTIAAIAINPGNEPITLKFKRGSVKNSFEAPYHPNRLMGVKPLGRRPWNTGPGDATAVQMLRGELDRRLPTQVTIPAQSRKVIVSTILPARGIANGLLRGSSNGKFQMAVVAAEATQDEADLLAVLDQGRLAPGRIYLNRIREIETRKVFSRVAGVALGDRYRAEIRHDLDQGALHIPLTSTHKHHFGTRDIQINPLSTRMIDSAINNVGTYGVRYDIDLNLNGSGAHELVLSHPVASGRAPFTAFRGSIRIDTEEGYREVHVGLRSGQSLPISELNLKPGQNNPVRVSLVYPADATPGHLLSVVPLQQLAMVKERQRLQDAAEQAITAAPDRPLAPKSAPPAPTLQTTPAPVLTQRPVVQPYLATPRNGRTTMPPAMLNPNRLQPTIQKRYQDAIRARQEWLHRMQDR